jgi:hypothetical protein
MALIRSCAILGMTITPASLLAAVVCGGGFSAQSLFVAVIAGGVCWLAAGLALVATWFGNRFQLPVQGLLLGMFFRMGMPLIAVVALPQFGGAFASGGLTMTILAVYLIALLTETLLAVRLIAPVSVAKPKPA